MATQTSTTQQSAIVAPQLTLSLSESSPDVPQWIIELRTRGWTVVPQTISKEKALAYADKAYAWLESWDLGYNRNDPSTRKTSMVPYHRRGGLYNRFGVAHEQFVWDLKSEPELIEKFAQIWGTNELLVSYDGVNLSIPEQGRPKTDPLFAPWPHVDQSPLRTNLQCVQGIVNLLPNGPEDGGLTVLEGSNAFYTKLWKHFDHKKGENGWNTWEQQPLDEEMCEWLLSNGCKWVKVCAQPGDLLLWDSRTVHYGAHPSSANDRFAAYVCYKPASMVTDEAKKERLEAFEKKQNTAHDPSIIRVVPRLPPEDDHSYEAAVKRPSQTPILSKRGRQLAGLDPY